MKIISKTISQIFDGKNKSPLFEKINSLDIFEQISNNFFNEQDILFEDVYEGKLYIRYPLSVTVEADVIFNSLHSLISEIRRVYKEIYDEEEQSMSNLSNLENSYNRGISNGKYGIWGHSIYDLCIEDITIYDENLINVSIGS